MAMAQTCPPGYAYGGGMCQPAPGAYAPNNPVSGAAAGASAGAAQGAATGGPVGAIVGGAIGTATGTIAGTTNALVGGPAVTTPTPAYGSSVPPAAPPPACSPGYMFYSGACYPAR
jgi:hypothetical protein